MGFLDGPSPRLLRGADAAANRVVECVRFLIRDELGRLHRVRLITDVYPRSAALPAQRRCTRLRCVTDDGQLVHCLGRGRFEILSLSRNVPAVAACSISQALELHPDH